MKKFLLACAILIFSATNAFAFKSSHFKGTYQVVSQQGAPVALERQFMSFDLDTLEVMWARYAGGAFPADLEPLAKEPTLLIRFTGRDTNFFALEGNALVTTNYMSLNSEGKQFEIRVRPDGRYDVAVTEKNKDGKENTTIYIVSRL